MFQDEEHAESGETVTHGGTFRCCESSYDAALRDGGAKVWQWPWKEKQNPCQDATHEKRYFVRYIQAEPA